MFFLEGPAHDFLPAPLWLLTALQVLTLGLHLLAMNFLFGGLVIVLVSRFEGGWAHPAVKRFVKLAPSLMAITVSLGVAPLLFAQLIYGRELYSASIISGWFWIAIPLLLIVAYYLLYASAFAKEGRKGIGFQLLLALLVMLFVSITYSGVFALAENPELQLKTYAETQSGLAFNPDLGGWLPRWLHAIFGALTVGGFCFGVLGRDDDRAYKLGKAFFSIGTGAAAISGVAYLMTLGDLISPFMKSPGIMLLTVGALAGFGAVFLYWMRRFFWAGLLVFVGVLGMVAARHSLRLVALEDAFDPSAIAVRPQWDVFALFVVCLLLAIGLIAWMLRVYFAAGESMRKTV